MTDKILEENLQAFDFSVFSEVRESLLEELLKKHRSDRMKNFKSLSQQISEEMSYDELDFVAAAGNPFASEKKEKI